MKVEESRQIVKRGEWLYDGTVPCEVRIIKANFLEHHFKSDGNPPDPNYPPRDKRGNFYLVEYEIKRGGDSSVSNYFASLEEAVNEATTKLNGAIHGSESRRTAMASRAACTWTKVVCSAGVPPAF